MPKPTCERNALEDPEGFRDALCGWFGEGGKDYPWRRTHDPYAVLVSEVMLQQTRIGTVLGRGFYTRFIERFPDTAALAGAGDDELLKAWEGLGYYRRARMLREAARVVECECGGRFPRDPAGIRKLPGVGRYTAGAVASFAFNQAEAVVDGNVARVLARLMDYGGEIDSGRGQGQLWGWAEELLDPKRPRIFNSALMELGQTACRPGVPDCLSCPVAEYCATREPENLPKKGRKVVVTAVNEHVVFVRCQDAVLLRFLSRGRRVGMWRLPEREAHEVEGLPVRHRRRYGITRYRVTMHAYGITRVFPRDGESWKLLTELEGLAMPPADRALLKLFLAEEIA